MVYQKALQRKVLSSDVLLAVSMNELIQSDKVLSSGEKLRIFKTSIQRWSTYICFQQTMQIHS